MNTDDVFDKAKKSLHDYIEKNLEQVKADLVTMSNNSDLSKKAWDLYCETAGTTGIDHWSDLSDETQNKYIALVKSGWKHVNAVVFKNGVWYQYGVYSYTQMKFIHHGIVQYNNGFKDGTYQLEPQPEYVQEVLITNPGIDGV